MIDRDFVQAIISVRRSVHFLEVFDKASESIARLPCNWH